MLFFAFIGSIFLIFFEKFLLLFKVQNVANEIETISVVTFSTWIRSIKSNDVYKVMLQIGVKCVQQIKMMIMKFTKRSYCELLKKALVWEYRISILTSVWRAFVTFLHILVIDYDVRYPIIGICAGFIFNILKRQEMEERRK